MPADIILRSLTPPPLKATSSPAIASRADLLNGDRTGGGSVGSTGFSGVDGEWITLAGIGFEAVGNPLPAAYDTFGRDLYPRAFDGASVPEDEGSPESRWGPVIDGITSSGYEFDASTVMPGREFSALSKGAKANLKNAKAQNGAP